MQSAYFDANTMQDSFESESYPDASAFMQEAQIYTGFNGQDMKKLEKVQKAEAPTKAMQEGTAEATLKTENLQRWIDECAPEADEERAVISAKQYVPIVYFVDKANEDAPSTCSGNVVKTFFGKFIIWSFRI